jgi:hypothetical protein
MKKIITKSISELKRILPLIIVVAIAFIVFKGLTQVALQLYEMSMVCVTVFVAHWVRKKLWPYASMEALVKKSEENPVAASIVFASIMLFLSIFIIVCNI